MSFDKAKWTRDQRKERRALGLCAFCGLSSKRYECTDCEKKKTRRATRRIAHEMAVALMEKGAR